MALIACPECRKKVSDSAGTCPNCGYQLTPEKIAEIQKMKRETQERATKGWQIFGWLPLIIGILFVYYLLRFSIDVFSSSDSPSSRSITSPSSESQKTKTSRPPAVLSGQEEIDIYTDSLNKLRKYLIGKSMGEIRRICGNPDRIEKETSFPVEGSYPIYWIYGKSYTTRDRVIIFLNKKVTTVTFY